MTAMQSSGNGDNRSENNFDFLRLFAAFSVLIFHSYYILGFRDPLNSLFSSINLGSIGVGTFFVISGYLIAKSWCNNPSIIRYLWSRILRIVPGLVILSLFTVLVIGPLTTSYRLGEYFTSGQTWSFFRIITVFGIFPHTPTLPGVFLHNLDAGAINGSLWSLPIEFGMYLGILVLGIIGLLGKKKLMMMVTVVTTALLLIVTNGLYPAEVLSNPLFQQIVVFTMKNYVLIMYPFLFMIGTLFFLFRDKIAYGYKSLIVVSAIWLLSLPFTVLSQITFYTCFPFIVLSLASLKLPRVNKVGRYGDFSYGMYIYGFTVQQTIISFFPGIAPEGLLLLATVVTLPLAVLSWHLIESRALKLKRINVESIYRNTVEKTSNIIR